MMKRLQSLTFDQAALGLAFVLLTLIGLVTLAGTQAGVLVTADLTEAERSPFEPITLTFSTTVNKTDVESRFALTPPADGQFEWLDAQTLRFVPLALQPDTAYELTLSPGKIGADGEPLRRTRRWAFETRAAQVAYIYAAETKNELWTVDTAGEKAERLLELEYSIFDFDVSPDGSFLVLSLFNAENRLDLWRVDRDGNNLQPLVDCGGGLCSAPAISPNGQQVAYTREAPGITPQSELSAARIHLLDLSTGEDRPVFFDSQTIGHTPLWSPDGAWLASFDSLDDTIRVVEIASGRQVLLSSGLGNALTWSPDSTHLAYTAVEEGETGLHTVVMLADFTNGDIAYLIGQNDLADYRYGSLAWSPSNAGELILGLRPDPESPPTGLWLIDPTLLEGKMIAEEENFSYYAPRWDPWGQAVAFQQFQLGTAYKSEIALWQAELSAPLVLAEGFSPHWLP